MFNHADDKPEMHLHVLMRIARRCVALHIKIFWPHRERCMLSRVPKGKKKIPV